MSLIQLTERVHVWRGMVNMALLIGTEKRLVLIDSGLDASHARKALRPFLEQGYQLHAIINTHSHADHIGGNAELVRRTGCQVWAPALEAAFIRFPQLEPIGLYGGVVPPSTLQVKFLQAEPTPVVHELPDRRGLFELAGVPMELIPTPGHALAQVAVSVDGVLVAADALFMPDQIERHPILYLVDVAAYLATLTSLQSRPERLILPGHGDLIDRTEQDSLPEVLAANRAAVDRLQSLIDEALQEGALTAEHLMARLYARLGKEQKGEAQYHLDRAAIQAHLRYAGAQGRVAIQFSDGLRLITNQLQGVDKA
ncbi:MAG TPA: MBL fold metallo-hydrolase [Symbiobacteriaceae bacterium]|nr:MBL fold metallo-hydrolase [Symbiobacteriaceae bacterium]